MTDLLISTSNSYQSISELTIECPICLEEIDNKLSFMTGCNHSWCQDCNTKLNKSNIINCPICKKEFIPFIKNGKWETIDGILTWKRGILDSQRLVNWKNRQAYFYNLFGNLNLTPGVNISGISV